VEARRWVWLVAVILLMGAACTDSDEPAASAEGPVTIQVQVWGEPEETAVYAAAVQAFKDQSPDIDVELVEVAERDDHLTRLATSFASGEPPDVFLINYREFSQFVPRGAIEPFGPYVEGRIDLENYYPQPIDAFTYGGELQCMPQNISSLVVYYNNDLFDKAGLAPPKEGWSWEEFRRTALALTGGDVRGLGIDPQIIRLAPFVWSNDGELVDDDETPSTFTLDTPEAREALEFIVGLVRDDEVVPTEDELAAEDSETRFIGGKLGMILSSRRDVPAFREVQGLNFDVAPLPIAEEPAGILHSDAYCITAESEHKEEAADLVSFIVGTDGATITAFGGRTVPSLKSVANSGAFLDPSRPPSRSRVFLDGIPYIRHTPVLPTWPEIEDVSEELITRLFYEDDYTIDTFIEELNEATDPLFEEGQEG
jgi:multiple sugar transport system substrate-binding protein